MMTAIPATADRSIPSMGFVQFVALIAALMAVSALALDTMLPALPAMGASLGIESPNQRQWIVTAYLLGLGSAQLFYGTLADRFGRKRVLLISLGFTTVFALGAALADSFETMMVARALQGAGAAASRVLAVSIVRDCYSGRPMARVMSFAFIMLLFVPIIAPSLGQLIMLVAPWRVIFFALAGFTVAVMAWVAFRLPETLHPEDRAPISPGRVIAAFRTVLTTRISIGYTIALTLILGGLFGFINSIQQVFADAFHAPELFTTIFAVTAAFVALASLLNARLVGRFGTHVLSHGALVAYIAISLIHLAIVLAGWETVVSFSILMALMMFCFGIVVSNFGAMAMEPLGHVAGTASSVQGFISTIGSALFGFWIGQAFDGTALPMVMGFAVFGIAGFLLVLLTERGRMFKPTASGIASAIAMLH